MKNNGALLEDITGTELAAGLPPGRTWRCRACGTRVRTGQPHTAAKPYGHGTVEALIVHEALPAPDGRPVFQP